MQSKRVWLMHGGAVSWRSVLQPTAAFEAAYMAAAAAAGEALWVRKLLVDPRIDRVADGAPRNLRDSQSALALMRNLVVSQRSKRIVMPHHIVQERAGRNEIMREYCNTELMVVDSVTKVVGINKFLLGAASAQDWLMREARSNGSVDKRYSPAFGSKQTQLHK
jgi:hypothetical protein